MNRSMVKVGLGVTLLVAASGCAATRGHRVVLHIERGEALLEAQELEAALAEFQAAAELAPQMAVVHSRMGVIYQRIGDYEQAAECFVEAIRNDPFSFTETFNLAQLYHQMHRVKEAVQAYLHTVQLKPNDFNAQLNLGVCYHEMGDFNQAAERFQKAIEIDPHRLHAYANLGVALDAQKKYYEAVRAYKEALERDPPAAERPLVLVNLAQTYMNQNRLKIAQQSLKQTIRMKPQLALAHEALGYCLFRMRDFEGAQHSYEQALAYDRRLPRAHAGLGSINMLSYLEDNTKTGRRDRALEHWHRSLELNPDQPRIRKLIAHYRPKGNSSEEVLLNEHSRP